MATIAKLVFDAIIYHIWWERNQRWFRYTSRTMEGIVQTIIFQVQTKVKGMKVERDNDPMLNYMVTQRSLEEISTTLIPKTCVWPKPPTSFWSLACDGALTNTRASYGGIICDFDRSPIMAYGGTSNGNHVLWLEFYALYKGLMLASSLSYTKL